MNCHRVQSLLSAYLDQELSPEERRLIRSHLFNCAVCAQCFEELSRIKKYLGSLEPPQPQINLVDNFLSFKLHVVETNPWVWAKRLALTAACVFLFLLTSVYLFPVNDPHRKIAGHEVEYRQFHEQFTPYQLVSDQSSNVNLFLQEEEAEEKSNQNKKKDHFYLSLPQHKTLIPGIPVSSR